MLPTLPRRFAGYAFALGIGGAAFLLRRWLAVRVGTNLPPYVLAYPAVMLAAIVYGMWPGIATTAMSVLLTAYYLLPPAGWPVGNAADLVGLSIFAGMGMGMSVLAERYHQTWARASDYAQQVQTLAGDLTEVEQRERDRLSTLLHDGLQQMLAAARIRVDVLARADPSRVPDICADVLRILSGAIALSRSLAIELNPPILQTAGLVPAFEWLAAWMQTTHALTVTFSAGIVGAPLNETARVLIFQAVRELLFNVVKHAGVNEASVTVDKADGMLRIVVADAGHGFEPAGLRMIGSGLGLSTIRQRLWYLGGTFHIASAIGQGSRFTLTVPLQRVL